MMELGDSAFMVFVLIVRKGGTPPRVFWKKRLQSIENKGRGLKKERQESSRDGKRLEGKEIEEVEVGIRRAGADETKVRRTFTSHNRAGCRNCQYLKWILVFRDWAQESMAVLPEKARTPRGDPAIEPSIAVGR
jgi:hypothetical protein